MSTARAQKFYTVPAGARPSQCAATERGGSCTAVIYWTTNPDTSRPLPIDCDVDGGQAPSESADRGQLDAFAGETAVFDGRGVSHFETCPDRDLFRRRAS